MSSSTYVCAICLGTFERTRSDYEVAEEAEALFGPGYADEGVAIICHVCWEQCDWDHIPTAVPIPEA